MMPLNVMCGLHLIELLKTSIAMLLELNLINYRKNVLFSGNPHRTEEKRRRLSQASRD